jgi:hypothetical protein
MKLVTRTRHPGGWTQLGLKEERDRGRAATLPSERTGPRWRGPGPFRDTRSQRPGGAGSQAAPGPSGGTLRGRGGGCRGELTQWLTGLAVVIMPLLPSPPQGAMVAQTRLITHSDLPKYRAPPQTIDATTPSLNLRPHRNDASWKSSVPPSSRHKPSVSSSNESNARADYVECREAPAARFNVARSTRAVNILSIVSFVWLAVESLQRGAGAVPAGSSKLLNQQMYPGGPIRSNTMTG